MHNATTKQRLSALRRRLGIFTGGWVKERRRRLADLEADLQAALTPAGAFPRPAAACAGGPAPSAFLATSLRPLSSAPPPPETTSTRWVSDSMIVPATQEVARPPPPAPTASSASTTEMLDAPEEARKSRTRWMVAIAAAAVAVAAVLFLALRSPEAGPTPRTPAASAPAPAAPVPAPAQSAMLPPLQAAPPLVAAAPAPAPAAAASPVLVRRGDTLWALSASHLGDPLRWPRLHRANREKIRDPDLIYPGQRLELPAR